MAACHGPAFLELVLHGPAFLESALSWHPPKIVLRPGRLLLVGLGDSRPEEGGPVSWALQSSVGPLFFLRAKGSRLGYPLSFTPIVVPEAGWASRLEGELRSSSIFLSRGAGS